MVEYGLITTIILILMATNLFILLTIAMIFQYQCLAHLLILIKHKKISSMILK